MCNKSCNLYAFKNQFIININILLILISVNNKIDADKINLSGGKQIIVFYSCLLYDTPFVIVTMKQNKSSNLM